MTEQTDSLRRILIVDDNEAIHADFRKILAPEANPAADELAREKAALFGTPAMGTTLSQNYTGGRRYVVDSALQGQEALVMLQNAVAMGKPYAVAFVDMRMPPGWDGVQTIQRLWDVDRELQVVICTAYSDHSWQDIADKLGLSDRLLVLKKPFDPIEVAQLATALSEKWLLRCALKLKLDDLERIVQNRTRELAHVALHDKLTALPNRAMFHSELDHAVRRSQADSEHKFAVLFLDFDRFKMVNDSLGHDAGDRLLKLIADRLTASLNLAVSTGRFKSYLAARLGGDEFVVLLEGLTHCSEASAVVDEVLRMLNTPYTISDRLIHSTMSVGITTSDLQYASADDVIRDADTAMYHAKAAGRARYSVFDRKMHDAVTVRLEMENDLRGAVERGEFVLHYQPIVSLASGSLEGFEALIRWQHPRLGLMPPAEFIMCCEETGLIIPVGKWVLNHACWQMRQWINRNPKMKDLSISVNVSAKQLADADLVSQVEQALQANGLLPSSLVLEITESVMIQDAESAAKVLRAIHALGVRLHMDDFGTGYSSLSCLHQFPLHGLKIDRAFMRNVGERRDYTAVVYAIVSLARNLGMKLIAEGIESLDQVVLLQSMECDLAQGYYFGRPMDAQAATGVIDKQLSVPRAA
jgi:diguanylate cyclase